MRLGGWQRIGIVLSVVWILGAFIYFSNAESDRAAFIAGSCYRDNTDWTDCNKEFVATYNRLVADSRTNIALMTLVPVPLAWLGVYLTVVVFRWVRKGFKTS